MVLIVVGGLAAGAGMLALRQIFPKASPFEGDQSHYVVLIYLGMVVVGGLMNSPLWFQSRLSSTEVGLAEQAMVASD